jgi:hypothetical protein
VSAQGAAHYAVDKLKLRVVLDKRVQSGLLGASWLTQRQRDWISSRRQLHSSCCLGQACELTASIAGMLRLYDMMRPEALQGWISDGKHCVTEVAVNMRSVNLSPLVADA